MEAKTKYRCTDCGKEITYAGTCADCLVKNRPVPERLVKDLRKKGKRNG